MHVQLHLKATWKDTMKLLPVLILERGVGLGSAAERAEGHLYGFSLLHKGRAWILSAKLKTKSVTTTKRESSWSPSFKLCIFPPISFQFNYVFCLLPQLLF